MPMNAARVANSPRLQRVLAVLSDGKPKTTRQIVRWARVMAVSACVAELRQQGAEIACWQEIDARGRRRWWYRLDAAPRTGGVA